MGFFGVHPDSVHKALKEVHEMGDLIKKKDPKLLKQIDAMLRNLDKKLKAGDFKHDEKLEEEIERFLEKAEEDLRGATYLLKQAVLRLEEERRRAA